MSATYYLGLSVSSLAIAIYNMNIAGSAKNLTCYSIEKMDYNTYKLYNSTLNITTPATNETIDPNTLYDVEVLGSNSYSTILVIIGIIYLIIMGFAVILSCIANYLSNQLPEDFLHMGKMKRFLACLCKVIPTLFIILHWIAMILIIVVWVFIAGKNCEVAKTSTPGVIINQKKYFNDVYILNIVNSSLWIFLHYGGAIVREITYEEPFMYSPDLGQPNFIRSFFLKKLGP